MSSYELIGTPETDAKLKAGLGLARKVLQLDGQDHSHRLVSGEHLEYSRKVQRTAGSKDDDGQPRTVDTQRDVIALADDGGLHLVTGTSLRGSRTSITATKRYANGNTLYAGPIILDRTSNPQNEQPRLHLAFDEAPSVIVGTPLFDIPVTDPVVANRLAAEALVQSVDAVQRAIDRTM